MKKIIMFVFMVAIATAANSQSAPTRLIPFQARLTDGANNIVPDNVYRIVFIVYNAPTGGGSIWTETHQNVSVINGQINVLLGSLTAISFDFKSPRYLGITIGGGPEMVPRHQLVPSFHAQTSGESYDSQKLGGNSPDFYASKHHVDEKIVDVLNDTSTNLGKINTNEVNISTNATNISANTTSINSLKSTVNTNKTDVSGIKNRLDSSNNIGLWGVTVAQQFCDEYNNEIKNGDMKWSKTAPYCRPPYVNSPPLQGYYACCDLKTNCCVGPANPVDLNFDGNNVRFYYCQNRQTCYYEHLGDLIR